MKCESCKKEIDTNRKEYSQIEVATRKRIDYYYVCNQKCWDKFKEKIFMTKKEVSPQNPLSKKKLK